MPAARMYDLARSMASVMECVKLLYEIEATLIIDVYRGKVHLLPPATLQHTRDRLIALVSYHKYFTITTSILK